MRISDWSSDVCSSDLHRNPRSGSSPRPAAPLPTCLEKCALRSLASPRPGSSFPEALDQKSSQVMRSIDAAISSVSNTRFQRSEEHTSELQSLMRKPYAVFLLKNKNETSQT